MGDTGAASGSRRIDWSFRLIAVTALLALFILYMAGAFVGVQLAMDRGWPRTDAPADRFALRADDLAGALPAAEVRFRSGANELSGAFYGLGGKKGLVVFSAERGEGAASGLAAAQFFAENGYAVFLYDGTGCCASGGKKMYGPGQAALDLDAALTFLEAGEQAAGLPVLLLGVGEGGYAAARMAASQHSVAAVAAVNAFDTPMEYLLARGRASVSFLTDLSWPVLWLYQQWTFGGEGNASAAAALAAGGVPALLLQSDGDALVSGEVALAAKREQLAGADVVSLSVSGRGHTDALLSDAALAAREKLADADAASLTAAERLAANAPDEALLGRLLDFYAAALAKK